MPRHLLATLGLLACAACGTSPIAPPLINDTYVGVHVRGDVRTSSGAPLAGATVEVWVRRPDTCTLGYVEGSAQSDATGAFSRSVITLNSPLDVCLWIAVEPPLGAAVERTTVSVRRVRLVARVDTVTVSVVLPALPTP